MAAVLFLAAVLAACLAGPGRAEALRATVRLKNNAQWEVEVLGRWGKDALRISRVGQRGEINLSIKDIARLDFPTSLDGQEVLDAYGREEFSKLTAALRPVLAPSLEYVDVPSNMSPYLRMYLLALYWSGDVGTLKVLTDQVLGYPISDRFEREARLLRVLALLSLDQLDEAAALLEELPEPGHHDENGGLFWYTAGRVRMAQERWGEAQENAAKIVAFAAKDFEWMPAGLYLSAKGYAETGSPDVARQIIDEMRMSFPRSRWRTEADKLAKALASR